MFTGETCCMNIKGVVLVTPGDGIPELFTCWVPRNTGNKTELEF